MSRLRVGLDVSSAARARGRGIARYVRSLTAALAALEDGPEAVLFLRNRHFLRRGHLRGLAPRSPRRWLLGPWGRLGDLDLFHGLGLRLPARSPVPRLLTLHDLRGLDGQEWTDARWIRLRSARLRETVARAEGILCPTAWGRERLFHFFPDFPRERSAVVPLGVDLERFRPADPEEARRVLARHGVDRPFLLQVGHLNVHKNPETVLEAFAGSGAAAAGHLLVFVGGAAPDYRPRFEEAVRRNPAHGQVRWIPEVPAADLPSFYTLAELVLFPSLYEGFGLPVLEAQACGAAGLVSDRPPLAEVAGEAWPAVPALDAEAWRRALDRMLVDAALLESSRRRSLERAPRFAWERIARETLAVQEALARGRPLPSPGLGPAPDGG